MASAGERDDYQHAQDRDLVGTISEIVPKAGSILAHFLLDYSDCSLRQQHMLTHK